MLFVRFTATNTGVMAISSAASSAGAALKVRRTRWNTMATVATPASACGNSSASGRKPKSFTDATCSHRASGGLSTEMKPTGSNDAYRKLCQSDAILRTAAV